MKHYDNLAEGINLLPYALRQTIFEVENKVRSPRPLILTSVLSTLSSAAQGYIDTTTIYGGNQPVSLYTLVIAESGERKSTTDKLISKKLADHERAALNAAKNSYPVHEVSNRIWQEKKKNIEKKLLRAISDEDEDLIQELKIKLAELIKKKPEFPITRHTLLSDVSPAAMLESLSGDNNVITLTSSEGGHLLNRSNMDYISYVNKLWDGDDITIIRKQDSYRITNGRLTLSLMLQPEILNHVLAKKERILRSSGYFSRMLITRPYSTQGYRAIGHQSINVYLDLFHKRINRIISESTHRRDKFKRVTLTLSPEAISHLQDFYHQLESQLVLGGFLSDVRDAASKLVNNATRIAALLHVYAQGNESTEIEGPHAACACHLARFYLGEFQSVFGQKSILEVATDLGQLLLDWLIKNNYRAFPTSFIMQYGPNPIRRKEKLRLAIESLVARKAINYWQQGKTTYIQLVPPAPVMPSFLVPS